MGLMACIGTDELWPNTSPELRSGQDAQRQDCRQALRADASTTPAGSGRELSSPVNRRRHGLVASAPGYVQGRQAELDAHGQVRLAVIFSGSASMLVRVARRSNDDREG